MIFGIQACKNANSPASALSSPSITNTPVTVFVGGSPTATTGVPNTPHSNVTSRCPYLHQDSNTDSDDPCPQQSNSDPYNSRYLPSTKTYTPTWTWTRTFTPALSISSISPNPVTYAFPTTITINGTGFVNGCNITYTGLTVPSSSAYFNNSNQVQLVFPRGYLWQATTCSVYITNPNSQVSNTYDFIADNTIPNITSVTSSSGTNVVPEGTSVSVTINGSDFTYVNTLPNCYFAWGTGGFMGLGKLCKSEQANYDH